MSCDIVSYAERLVHGHWLCVAHQPFDAQNYGFFGWLADVRNYAGMAPIAAYRGFPVYSSETVWRGWDEKEGHSTSWVLVSELLAVDYEQMVEDRRCTVQVGPNAWNGGATCEPGQGELQTLREFLGPVYFRDLDRLQRIGAERVVFWFRD